jgi:hypothetical protein
VPTRAWLLTVCLQSAFVMLLVGCGEPARTDSAGSLRATSQPTTQLAPAIEAADVAVQAPETTGRVILRPSHGRPVVLAPGEVLEVLIASDPRVTADSRLMLQHARAQRTAYLLHTLTAKDVGDDQAARRLMVQVPIAAVAGVYDLELITTTETFRALHAVRVGQFDGAVRFVHLSNMNVGDLTAPAFDEGLPAEVNLINPAFIVATGDFEEWARLRNDATSWPRVLDYLGQFDAPVVIVCGDHDHEASFTRHVANSLIGTFECGPYRFLLLLDHGLHNIRADGEQLAWLADELAGGGDAGWNILVGHSDELDLLDEWRSRADLSDFVQQNRLRMYITGGHVDWDYREFAGKLADADGLVYVRTHQSSSALRDKATGISHYRVIELRDGDVDWIYPVPPTGERRADSTPVGLLSVHYDGPNDGSQPTIMATIHSGLNRSYEDGRVWLRLAKQGARRPKVAGGELVRAFDEGGFWLLECAVRLPQLASTTVGASVETLPDTPPIEIQLAGDSALHFRARQTAGGLRYYSSDQQVKVVLTNRGDRPYPVWPIVRLLGREVPFVRQVRQGLPVMLPAGQSVELPLQLMLGQVWAGEHEVHVYLLDDPLQRLHSFPVEVTIE